MNNSSEPVTEVVVYLVWVQGNAYKTGEEVEEHYRRRDELVRVGKAAPEHYVGYVRACIHTLPPGLAGRVILGGPESTPMQGRLGVEIAFTDAAGKHWVRTAGGTLISRVLAAVEHYGVNRPIGWASPTPA